ncbi:CPBP family intramembrane glutamic endopeptidase [Clostridium sp. BNL1100]|uniref:CPBP family intramembrane glutamic endopeptidase n=1 Tax=Clostridium sp. BNL1100 TaxID=755731 RepID=UPI00024A7FDA|nr:CPBP family intramembrane glutamic endopeptidase [Clostridium sp. BNL1100]AEY68090.1 CAAX amino terminal protease family [Clostridium sp. BNL1100]
MKKVLSILLIPVEIALLFFLSYFINGFLNNNLVQAYLLPIFRNILNPNIASLFLNGIVNAIFAFIIIVFIGIALKIPLKGFGFNMLNYKFSIKATIIFLTVFIPLYAFFGTIAAKYNLFSYTFSFPLNTYNFIFYAFFELFVSGLEEIYFRSFLITIFLMIWRHIFKTKRGLETAAITASTIIFALRHIGMTMLPFTITYLVPLQILVVVIMGFSFGYIFVKSKSLLGGYLAHGISNSLITMFLLVLNLAL